MIHFWQSLRRTKAAEYQTPLPALSLCLGVSVSVRGRDLVRDRADPVLLHHTCGRRWPDKEKTPTPMNADTNTYITDAKTDFSQQGKVDLFLNKLDYIFCCLSLYTKVCGTNINVKLYSYQNGDLFLDIKGNVLSYR